MMGLSISAKWPSGFGSSVTGNAPDHDVLTGETIYLEVVFGDYTCNSGSPSCLIGSDMPPVEIQVFLFSCPQQAAAALGTGFGLRHVRSFTHFFEN